MQYFKEDVEVYLSTFERLATANQWERGTWAPRLAALLTGKAREAYARMEAESAGNYEKVKTAILARYDLTPETYRRKFRNSKKYPDESFQEWGIRARRYFDRWVGLSVSDAKKLAELIIMEQMLNNMSPDLQIWLREHNPKTVDSLTGLAENYRLARQNTYSTAKTQISQKLKVDYSENKFEKISEKRDRPQLPMQSSQESKAKYVTCYSCHKKGHYADSCPEKQELLAFVIAQFD